MLFEAATQTVRNIASGSEPIGVEKTTEYKDVELQLHTGDIVFIYSDGLVESLDQSGKQYTKERLIDIVSKNSSLSGKEIANLVKTDINKFGGATHQHDDQTLLVIKIQ
jgi:sigma-B regulation protein RsbU (phosphoserine phosphatase)